MSKRTSVNRALSVFLLASTVCVLANIAIAESPDLLIEPIPGLTTARHVAPLETTLPLGTLLQLRQMMSSPEVPDGFVDRQTDTDPGTAGSVVWSGVDFAIAGANASVAQCTFRTLGVHVVSARFVDARGSTIWENTCTINVVDISIETIDVDAREVSVAALALEENMSNEETRDLYFSSESIAALRWVPGDNLGTTIDRGTSDAGPTKHSKQASMGRYVTSNQRTVSLGVDVDPLGLSSLMEWRVDGKAVKLAPSLDYEFDTPGLHTISVGPPSVARQIPIETYDVIITSHTTSEDLLPEGEPVTLEALTNPPGYEDDITWLSTTKYGTGTPVLGTGPTFTVQFDHTWAFDESVGTDFQWFGVKADNVVFNQDQKTLASCCLPESTCTITSEESCLASGRTLAF